jgi:hypothetical protein
MTNEVERARKHPAAVAMGKLSAAARMKSTTAMQRSALAKHAAQARWNKRTKKEAR